MCTLFPSHLYLALLPESHRLCKLLSRKLNVVVLHRCNMCKANGCDQNCLMLLPVQLWSERRRTICTTCGQAAAIGIIVHSKHCTQKWGRCACRAFGANGLSQHFIVHIHAECSAIGSQRLCRARFCEQSGEWRRRYKGHECCALPTLHCGSIRSHVGGSLFFTALSGCLVGWTYRDKDGTADGDQCHLSGTGVMCLCI